MSLLSSALELWRGFKLRDYSPPKREDLQPAVQERPAPFEIPSVTAAWQGIVWHHSATPDNPLHGEWDGIRKYHMSYRVDGNIVTKAAYESASASGGRHCEKPWSDIGYHLGIEREGGSLVVRIGRPWNKPGAHAGFKQTNKYNETFLGCCLVGNFDLQAPDQETMDLCVAVTRHIMNRFNIVKSNVLGHRETYDQVGVPRQKTCPGNKFDLELFRSRL